MIATLTFALARNRNMTVLRTSTTTLLLLACVSTIGCDDGVSGHDQVDALESSDDDALPYASANVPFDPEAVDEPTRTVAASVVTVTSADGEALPDDVLEEVEDMRLRFAHALVVAKGAPYFAARSADEERIEITYLGKGRVAPAGHDFEGSFHAQMSVEAQPGPFEPPAKYRDDATWITGFNPATRSEFEVRIPPHFSEAVGADADAHGPNCKADDPGLFAEEVQLRHQVGSADTRVRKGAIDTAQTSTNLSRIARVGYGCSGVLIGQNQVLTDGHCLYGNSGWNSSTRIRVGANGTASHEDITVGEGLDDNANVTSTANNGLFWVSSLYKAAKDSGSSTIAYDIGTIVLPNDPIGQTTGWFEIATPSNTSHDDMLNRGYPACGLAESPPGCADPDNWYHMFGDTNACGTGGFSTQKDSAGYSLYGYHSCDASKGQSGSPLYRDEPGKGWAVRGMHVGVHRYADLQSVPDSIAALSVTLITQSRKDLFDLYNAMYTSL